MRPIEVASPGRVFASMREQLLAACAEVLDSGSYILAEEVSRFEREWAAYCGTAFAVGVSSGTDALALALRASGVGVGCEVLVPAMTATATWAAVVQAGAVPVGVDIEAEGCCIAPELAAAAITARTKAIVAVHLFGHLADVGRLSELAQSAGVALVEDAAQAHGASWSGRRAGSFGAAAAFSFYPTKNLGALGDAGAVTTGDGDLAGEVRALRQYGWDERREAIVPGGINARLDELQAAFLRVALARLDEGNRRRRRIAASYLRRFATAPGLQAPVPRAGSEPVWHQFVIRHGRRDELARQLADRGVRTAIHYARPPGLDPAFAAAPRPAGGYPEATRHAAQALSLPIHPSMSDAEVTVVCDAVTEACAALAS